MFTSILKSSNCLKSLYFNVRHLTNTGTSVSALRNLKSKSQRKEVQYFVDSKRVRAVAGKGGDGCISFLSVWCNENAGTDGGDGGNGAHIIFEATNEVNNLNHVNAVLKGTSGDKGTNKNCYGKNASHNVVKVPIGTIVRNSSGKVVGDLYREGVMFVAARGGTGGKGNKFFTSSLEQSPQICEIGAEGEDITYTIELRSMADIGFLGFPNAGKSTLLQAVTRARPKIAPYPFTTLRPHLGVVQYSDYEQVVLADLPGLIEGSHQNKGLGIQFLKHAERCRAILYVIDSSVDSPWIQYKSLREELSKFSSELLARPKIIVANKIDLLDSDKIISLLENNIDHPVIPVSAKTGLNLANLLNHIRIIYDKSK